MPYNYQHRQNGNDISGATNAQYVINGVEASDAGSYSIRIVNNGSGEAMVIQLPQPIVFPSDLPVIVNQPVDAAVVVGQTALFQALAEISRTVIEWQWYSSTDGVTFTAVSGASGQGESATLSLTAALVDDGKQYRAVFTNVNGSRTTSPVSLAVADDPITGNATINGSTGTQTLDAGVNALFAFAFTGDGSADFDYQWQKSIATVWTDINGAISQSYLLSSISSGDAGDYRVGVSFEGQLLTYFTITLAVTPVVALPTIDTQPTNQSVELGSPVTFTSVGADATTWAWQVSTDGSSWSAVSGATGTGNSATLTFTPVLDDNGLLYRAAFTNASGTTNSNAATLTVTAPPVLGSVRFGDLTPAGQGEQNIDAANGTYSVGGGSFSVSSGRINVVTMPSVGTYEVDGVSVEVVANARTCSTTAEIAAMWTAAAATHPVGTKILLAPGAYNLFPLLAGGSGTYLRNNWDWQALDTSNKPTIATSSTGLVSYEPSSGSPGCAFDYIDFYREQDPVGVPWNVVVFNIFQVRFSVTNMRFRNCRFYGNFVAAAQGGKITTKLVGLSTEASTGVLVEDCEFDHLCTAFQLQGAVDCNNNSVHDIYSDYFEIRAGVNGSIVNNHMYNMAGDGTFLHGDWFQVQVPPRTPGSGPLLIEGNTCALGQWWNLAAGQAHHAKPSPTLSTAGPHVMNIATHHGARQINCRVADAGGTMAITLPAAAVIGEHATFCLYQIGAGTVTVTLSGGDTADGPLVMSTNNAAISFVSDGVSNWSVIQPGYRAHTQIRTTDKTLDALENGLSVFANASSRALSLTLPSGTDYYIASVKKDDTTANLVSVLLPSGQSFTDHGVAGLTSARTLSRCGEVMEFERLAGTSVWLVTEKEPTSQGFLSNGFDDPWTELVCRYNIFHVNSTNGWRPDDNTMLGAGFFVDGKYHNNTILRTVPDDVNGDGVVADSDTWFTGTAGSVYVYDGIDTFRNAITGAVVDNGPTIRKAENVSFGWTDPEDLTALNVYLAASTPAQMRPTTRAETVAAALVKTGSPLIIDASSYSFIGAVGTTATNGPYNWETGAVNANTKAPLLASMLPADGETAVPTNTTVRLNFDELVTLGTGNISIRTVGGAEIEAFDVATSDRIAFSGDGVTIVVTPTSALPADTNVCVRIAATAVDGYFNSFVGITDDSLNFTTAAGAEDPERLGDPSFDSASSWASGSSLVALPLNGWSVSGGFAVKVASTNFRDIRTNNPQPTVTPTVTYSGTVTIGAITTAAGNLRVQLQFVAADGTTILQTSNSETALSALSPTDTLTHTATAPADAASCRFIIIATAGTAEFTLSSASLQAA